MLVRPEPREQDLEALRRHVAARDAALAARAAEVAQVRATLEAFAVHYRQHVGLLHEELDELETQLAALELGELHKRLDERGGAPSDRPAAASAEAPRFTSDAARKLFREVARSVHPDLASDDTARQRRHALMVQANRAYAIGDEDQLRRILEAWDRSPDAVPGGDPQAMAERLRRRLMQLDEEGEALDGELAALRETPIFKLKTMVDAATADGKDLITEMIRRLQRELLVTRNRLDAMRC